MRFRSQPHVDNVNSSGSSAGDLEAEVFLNPAFFFLFLIQVMLLSPDPLHCPHPGLGASFLVPWVGSRREEQELEGKDVPISKTKN